MNSKNCLDFNHAFKRFSAWTKQVLYCIDNILLTNLCLREGEIKNIIFSIDFSADDFELLCDDGSRAPVTDYETCNWGTVPSNAIVTTSAKSPEQRRGLQDFLKVTRSVFMFLLYCQWSLDYTCSYI